MCVTIYIFLRVLLALILCDYLFPGRWMKLIFDMFPWTRPLHGCLTLSSLVIIATLKGRYCYAYLTNKENKVQGRKRFSQVWFLCIFSPSPSSSTLSPLLTILHFPAPFMACLPTSQPSGIFLLCTWDLLFTLPFSTFHWFLPWLTVLNHYNRLNKKNHLLSAHHCAGHWAWCSTYITSFSVHERPKLSYYYFHFKREKVKTQRSTVTCPSSSAS